MSNTPPELIELLYQALREPLGLKLSGIPNAASFASRLGQVKRELDDPELAVIKISIRQGNQVWLTKKTMTRGRPTKEESDK